MTYRRVSRRVYRSLKDPSQLVAFRLDHARHCAGDGVLEGRYYGPWRRIIEEIDGTDHILIYDEAIDQALATLLLDSLLPPT